MAIRSMTGFGRAAADLAGVRYAVEIRSVNHRFLDLKTRLPRELSSIEPLVRRRVAARVERGRVDVVVSAVGAGEGGLTDVVLDLPLARRVVEAHRELATALGLPDGLDTGRVGAWPGVLRTVSAELDGAEIEATLGPALDAAVEDLVAMRTVEGVALADTLVGHLDRLEGWRARLAARAPAQAKAYRARLEERLRAILADLDVELDAARVLHEVAVFAERTDVAEELARLDSHLAQARALLDGDAADGVGRRLDFLCQELLREANTVGSKVQDVELSAAVVELKGELERFREQIQNVE